MLSMSNSIQFKCQAAGISSINRTTQPIWNQGHLSVRTSSTGMDQNLLSCQGYEYPAQPPLLGFAEMPTQQLVESGSSYYLYISWIVWLVFLFHSGHHGWIYDVCVYYRILPCMSYIYIFIYAYYINYKLFFQIRQGSIQPVFFHVFFSQANCKQGRWFLWTSLARNAWGSPEFIPTVLVGRGHLAPQHEMVGCSSGMCQSHWFFSKGRFLMFYFLFASILAHKKIWLVRLR